jgi:hypothetical protein
MPPPSRQRFRSPRRHMPGTKLPDHATKSVEDRTFELLRNQNSTPHLQFYLTDDESDTSESRGLRFNKLDKDDELGHGISWQVEGEDRFELIMDGDTATTGWSDFGIWDHSGNDGAGGYVMRISSEITATVDTGCPKFWFGRAASTPAAENVAFSFYAGDDVDTIQGMRISHYGGVNDNALGLLNRNSSIKTCRFNFNTLWVMGTDILGTNATDFWFYDNVNNLGRIFIKAESNPLPKIGIGSASPQAALSVLLDINAAANTIQRVFHSQIANDPGNRAVNIETIREAGVAVWNYIWLAAWLGTGSTVGTRVATSSGARAWGWECSDNELNMASAPSGTNQTITRPIRVDFSGGVHRIGFFNVTPQARPAAYTQTFSTASRTMNAYTSDPESGAYTGIDNAQVGTVYATVADLNTLRVAYETLRAMSENVQQVVNSIIDDHQGYGLFQ